LKWARVVRIVDRLSMQDRQACVPVNDKVALRTCRGRDGEAQDVEGDQDPGRGSKDLRARPRMSMVSQGLAHRRPQEKERRCEAECGCIACNLPHFSINERLSSPAPA
jgi:hypothetical protein